MPETYAFAIQNDKTKSYNRIGYLLIIINVLCLFFIATRTNNEMAKRYAMVGGLLTLLWLVLIFLRYYGAGSRTRLLPGYLFPAFIWFQLGFYWVTVVIAILAVLDYLTRRPLVVKIKDQHILYPSLPVQEIAWTDLQNLILKDGLLTIDYKNNRVRQVYIEDDLSADEEAEFNTFAAGKLISEDSEL